MNEASEHSSLPPKRRRELRARAHALKPVVWVAQSGMSEGAMREVDRALTAHELIKIHAVGGDRQAREALLETLCRALSAEPVQIIGKTLIVFRARAPQEPQPAKGSRSVQAKLSLPPRRHAASQRRSSSTTKRRDSVRRSKRSV